MPWPTGSREEAGSTSSATEEAPPTPHHLLHCSCNRLGANRQLIAHAVEADIAIGLSTSGNSRNLLYAFREASERGLLTVGIAGYSGGDMARSPHVQHCLLVDDDSVHRIQETQAALGFALWSEVQQRCAAQGFGKGVRR